MPQTVASFDPRLIEALRVGSRQILRIPLATHAQAERLRFRFHTLKAALRREKHPLTIVTDKTHVKISTKRDAIAWLEVRPADSEFADVLAAALPHVEAPNPTPIIHSEPAPESHLSELSESIRSVINKET